MHSKLRKTGLRLFLKFLAAVLFLAFFTSTSWSQDLSGLSICIDPGHGAGVPNQGPTGLREANIDLTVSLFLKEFLESANIDTVLLTRVDDSTNPTLTQREALANNFGVDWFHSVHHNACGAVGVFCTARRTLVLIEEQRGSSTPCSNSGTGQPAWPGLADVMSNIMGNRMFQGLRTTSTRTSLDWTFYGGCNGGFSLGVLNDLQMPGELSEATFHQNQVEENKLRNDDFLKLEARALFMGFLDFYEAGTLPIGALSGIITSEETGDPVNGAEVLLNPIGESYTTDSHNNGFYAFHDLPPATYEIVVSANGFIQQARSVDVQAHAFSFGDLALETNVAPIVTQTLPSNATLDYNVYNEIGVRFSRAMVRQSVQDAFVLTPDAAGHFIWNSNDDVVLFEPDTRFDFETNYEVRILGTAQDQNGRRLDGNGDGVGGDDFLFNFTTEVLDSERPVVLDFFPVQRDSGIFLREVIRAQFSEELAPGSVNSSTVLLADNSGINVDLQIDYVEDGSRQITLIPKAPLSPAMRHFVTFTNAITLPGGEGLQGNFRWQFETQSSEIAIDFIDDFETGFSWADPNQSDATRGVVADSTSFQLTQTVFVSGNNAAELRYQFSSQPGFLQSDNLDQPDIDLETVSEVGFYLYGDNSENEIRLFFEDIDGEEAVPWTRINWTGWRLLRFDLTEIELDQNTNGNGFFDSKVVSVGGIQLNFTGVDKGRLLLDDFIRVLPENPVSVESSVNERSIPEQALLAQNYPNPFNPSTEIHYRVPTSGTTLQRVQLEIFNLQGKLVRTLIKESKPAGEYKIVWDGKNDNGEIVTSGPYIYQIRIGELTESKRMIFLK